MNESEEIEVRMTLPRNTYNGIRRIQGIFTFKEGGKKTTMKDLYVQLIDRGIMEIMKQNK